ncbi:ABC transporter substrate binding protein [Candidatus Omnitrophota bacterium]
MRKYLVSAVLMSLAILMFSSASVFAQDLPEEEQGSAEKVKTVAFLIDGESKTLKESAELITEEIKKLSEDRYLIQFKEVLGDFDRDTIRFKLDELLNDSDTDLIICLGFISASKVLKKEGELAKPVILADVFDVGVFGMPYVDGASGRKNLTYMASTLQTRKNVGLFREIVPFKKVHILIDKVYQGDVETLLEKRGDLGIEIVFVNYMEDPEETLEAFGEDVEAVYVAPSELLSAEYNEAIIEGLNERKIPSFAHAGEAEVEMGILAGLVPKFYTKFARRVAINVDRILKGEEAGEISVEFDAEFELVINAETASRIGVSIPFSFLLDAKIHNPYACWGELLTIQGAVGNALENNLNFRIREEEIRRAKKEHLLRWSEYLPDIGYSLKYDINDSETAKTSLGLTPKWYLKNRFTLSQLIFSDPVITNILNSKQEIYIERLNRQTQELDITDETSRAYLQYLITRALFKVAMDNLAATKHNLEMAKKRNKIGVGGKEEIMRWESELADRQSNVLRAESDIMTVRVTLNQLMNHPQETPFCEEDVGLEITRYYIGGGHLKSFVKNEEMLKLFIDFMVEQGLRDSPELKALNLAIDQQERIKDTTFRKFFLPEANLEGYLDHKLSKKYYGMIPQNENDDWFVGLSLDYSIFEGGARGFDFDKQKAEEERLIFTEGLTEQFTELDIRKAAYSIYFSLPNIELSRKAMVSATGNYKIMEEKYSRGTASITALIDAQNDKFTRESQAVIAVYEFLQDLTTFDRAISHFHFFAPNEDKEKWMEALRKYFADRGVDVEFTM